VVFSAGVGVAVAAGALEIKANKSTAARMNKMKNGILMDGSIVALGVQRLVAAT
jgi:hypothetical protein